MTLPPKIYLAAITLLLAACVSQPTRQLPSVDVATAEAKQFTRETRLRNLTHWSLQGRIAVSSGSSGGSGRIDWKQNDDHYDVSLSAPVTRQSWRLSGNENSARLEGLDGGPREGANAEILLFEATRWEIPLAALTSWLRGARADNQDAASFEFAADGRLLTMTQSGWAIAYSDWRWQPGTEVELPTRLTATRDRAKVRLVVDQWIEGAEPQ